MDNTRKLEFTIFLASTILAAFIYMNEVHAPRQALLQTEFELRAEILEGQAKGYAETANHYRNIERDRTLEPSEVLRKEYTARKTVEKQEKADRVQETLTKLKID